MTLQLARRNKNKMFSAILKTVLVLALAEYFYLHPILIMSKVSETTNAISTSFAGNLFSANDISPDKRNQTNAVSMAANGIYVDYVHKPW